MRSHGRDNLLHASDRQGKHHDRTARHRLQGGEDNTMLLGYRLKTGRRIVGADPESRVGYGALSIVRMRRSL